MKFILILSIISVFTACSTSSETAKNIRPYRSTTDRNPILVHTFGADPCVLVYNDRVYLYLTGDTFEYEPDGAVKSNSYSTINTLRVISSDDLANWTYHDPIPAAGRNGIAKWAERSWAPDITYKKVNGKDKFFLYFSNNANGVGVLTADDPLGPWTDPIGKALINRQTPNCQDVPWVFDPAVFIDDDGKAYLYFGGGVPTGKAANPGSARGVMLNDDMISLAHDPVLIEVPYFFEASSMNKIDGRYLFSYCVNWNVTDADRSRLGINNAVIAYMSGTHPLGPFSFEGTVLRNPGSYFGVTGNNHHTIFEFKNKWYITYHTQILEQRMGVNGKGYRAPHIDAVTVKDGKFELVQATRKGVDLVVNLNPFIWQKGSTTGISAGLSFESEYAVIKENASWLGVYGADFGSISASSFSFNARANENNRNVKIEIRLGSPEGDIIGSFDSKLKASFENYSVELTETVTGIHDVYFVFRDGSLDFSGWQFM